MIKTNKKYVFFPVILVMLIIMFFFIFKSNKNDVIKIGVILDLTGPVSTYGEWSRNGLILALEEINLDKEKFRLIIEDGKSETSGAVYAFNKLINIDKVNVIIITAGSSSVLSLVPIANEKKIVLFTPAASAPEITKSPGYIFRNRLNGLQEVHEMSNFAYQYFGLRRGIILKVNNDFGQSYSNVFENTFTNSGGKILDVESYEQGSTDVRTQLSKIKQFSDLDFIFLIGYAVECGQILKQSKELGINCKWLSTIGIESEKVIQIAGESADGVIYTAPRYRLEDPYVIPFEKKYYQKYNEHSNMYAANSYDALKIIVQVINQVGYESEKIRSSLLQVKDYPGVSGVTTFDKNGDVIKPVMLKIIKDSKFEIYDIK
jgi:branched-chain amino acid transport system substrate-binding protein